MQYTNSSKTLAKMLDQLTADYLKMSGQLLKLLEMKDEKNSPEQQQHLLLTHLSQLGEQAQHLITVMIHVAQNLTDNGNSRN